MDIASILLGGGVVILPTDTIYGLHALANNEAAIQRIVAIKGRGEDKPFVVVGASIEQLEQLGAQFDVSTRKIVNELWPGPLTAIVPIQKPIAASRGTSKIAVRIPKLDSLHELLQRTGPLASTSVNRTGEPPLVDPKSLARDLQNSIDAIVQFDVFSGAPLFQDPNFTVSDLQTTNHRQIWMRTDKGQFKDKRVRQALALSLDRDAMLQQLFQGKAQLGNDHVIWQGYKYFDSSVAQRTRNVDQAKQLLSDAGVSSLSATLHVPELQEVPDLGVLIQSQAKEAGITLEIAKEQLGTFYGAQWCPAEPKDPPCSGAAELGIVDYGHRPTPDVFLNSAFKTKGVWNSSQWSNADFDAAFAEFQAAVGVDAQKAACKKIETIMNEEVPVALPYFYDFLSGQSKAFNGVYSSALGQMFFEKASATA